MKSRVVQKKNLRPADRKSGFSYSRKIIPYHLDLHVPYILKQEKKRERERERERDFTFKLSSNPESFNLTSKYLLNHSIFTATILVQIPAALSWTTVLA